MAYRVPSLGLPFCVPQMRKRLLYSSLTSLPNTCWLLQVISIKMVRVFLPGAKMLGSERMRFYRDLDSARDRRIIYFIDTIKLR
jgi:hypothetical protein